MGLILESLVKQVLTRPSRQFITQWLSSYPRHDFALRFWDGTSWGNTEQPRFTLVINHPRGLRKMFFSPSELGLGEGYIFGDLDVEGDLQAAFELGDYLVEQQSAHPSVGVRPAQV
jgi:hypothetical protein